jgi:hypothetical protein
MPLQGDSASGVERFSKYDLFPCFKQFKAPFKPAE